MQLIESSNYLSTIIIYSNTGCTNKDKQWQILSFIFLFSWTIIIYSVDMKKIIEYLFPQQCVGCGKTWSYFCEQCHKKYLQSHRECCPCCHRWSRYFLVCAECRQYQKDYPVEWIMIACEYKQQIKKLILWLKYYHRYDLHHILAEKIALQISTNPLLNKKNLTITFVPSHRRRKFFVKWYNQAELLAHRVADLLGKPCVNLAHKTKATRSQANLSRRQRLSNLDGVFSAHSKQHFSDNDCIVIIDDVTTTWSTIISLARAIKISAPQSTIWWCVVARKN